MAQIQSGASADLLTVDATSKAGRATLYDASGNAISRTHGGAYAAGQSGLPIIGVNDDNYRLMRMDRMGGQALANVTPLLIEPFEGTVLAANRWIPTATTMTGAQTAASGLQLNASAITTINTGYLYTSFKQFQKVMRAPLHFKARLRIAAVANSYAEWGFGNPASAIVVNTIGAYWQQTTGGAIQPVVTFNSVDTTGTNVAGSLNSANYYTWDVIVDDDQAIFMVQDTATGLIISEQVIRLPLTQQKLWNSTHLPAIFRLANSGSAPASAPIMFVTDCYVGFLDTLLNRPSPVTAAQLGYNALYNPTLMTQAAQHANSAAPASATLSNTAAGYTTLGGLFQFAAVAGAATDYNLFNYTITAPYQFVLTRIKIDTYNTGAVGAAGLTTFVWALGTNGTTANLSTGGYIRVPLGVQCLPTLAAIGQCADKNIDIGFITPIVCEAGRLLSLILRMPIGTATASQVIAGAVLIQGYFE